MRAVVLLSGGIDSAACVHFLQSMNYNVEALFINYNQAALDFESKAANSLAKHFGIPITTYTIAIPNHEFSKGEIFGRNAFLIFTAALYSKGRQAVLATGIHSGTNYIDCSESYLSKIETLLKEESSGIVTLFNPFLKWNKAEIYKYFIDNNLPYDVTYSCESGSIPVCGGCASCKDREKLWNLWPPNDIS